jgi:hypothetical protein
VVEPYPSIEIQFEGDVLEVIDPDEDIDRFSRIEPWKPTKLEEFTGRYRSEEIEGGIEIALERDDLVVRHRTIDADPLKPTRADSFYVDGLSLSFTRDPSGKVNGFLLDMGRVKGITYEREK